MWAHPERPPVNWETEVWEGIGWQQRAKPDMNYNNINEKRIFSLKQQAVLELTDMEKSAKILL